MSYSGNEIAVIGIDLKFPGSNTIDEFWNNLCEAKESIRDISDFELESDGINANLFNKKNYIKRISICDDYDKFDAAFFGYSNHEAKIMDPQHRLFLQSCWKALEQAGYVPSKINGQVGVFGSAGYNTYLINALLSSSNYLDEQGYYDVMVGNDKDYLATKVSYKMGLTGPSVTVQTACSSSLVGVHLACQSLLLGESDICLAGGVCISVPCKKGYEYQPGFIVSEDGHCRAFDKNSSGTVFGSGVGVVVLKRLEEAIADNDTIYSVIKATAINNDGNRKIGFTAPSQEGQEDVLRHAMNLENIEPQSISFIEAHGTGTILGDPIELRSIMNSWGLKNSQDNIKYPCAIGSVKSNIGHMDVAAGIAGLIKASLCVYNKTIVPTVHFKELNTNVSFDNTRFYIAGKVEEISNSGQPIRGAVSAFGVGGTNVSIILEEPPALINSHYKDSKQYLIKVSAKTKASLERMVSDISKLAEKQIVGPLAYTLNTGREDFDFRTFLVVEKRVNGDSDVQSFNNICRNENAKKFFVLGDVTLEQVSKWDEIYQQIECFRKHINNWLTVINKELGVQCESINGIIKVIEENKQLQKIWLFVIQTSWIMAIKEITNTAAIVKGYGLGKVTQEYLENNITASEALKLVQNKSSFELIQSINLSDNEIYCECFDMKQLLYIIGVLWQNGAVVNWEELFADEDKRRVPAPTYSFEKTRYWYKENESKFSFVWKEKETELNIENNTSYDGRILILGAENNKLNEISSMQLRKGKSQVTLNKEIFDIPIHNHHEYRGYLNRLILEEQIENVTDIRIVCLWGMTHNNTSYEQYYKILYLLRHFNEMLTKCKHITVVFVNACYYENDNGWNNMLTTGIATTLSMEYPSMSIKQINVNEEPSEEMKQLIVDEIYKEVNEKTVILHDGKRFTNTYENVSDIPIKQVLRDNGNYIITGGTGNVGLLFAKEISNRVNANIFLISKNYNEESLNGKKDEKASIISEVIATIRQSGSRVFVIKADVSDYNEFNNTISYIEKENGNINAVIHAAGKVGKACNYAENIQYEDVVDFGLGKVEGAYNLDKIFKNRVLDFCILVSSTVSVLGGLGDSIYSGTNAVLNYMAKFNHSSSIPYLAVAFDYLPRIFKDVYVSEDDKSVRNLLINQLTLDEFSKTFDQILSSIRERFIVISKNSFISRYHQIFNEKNIENTVQTKLHNELNKIEIKQKVCAIWRRVLENECDENQNFFDAGGDSFSSIKLISALNDTFDMKVSVKYIYEYPSIALISENIYSTLNVDSTSNNKSTCNVLDNHTGEQEDDLVVIGMAGRFPGADNVDELWSNILNRECHISHFEYDSDDNYLNALPDGRLNKHVGARGIINDVDKFDYEFFNISKLEAELMDPQQRIFLECAWKAVEDAGCLNILEQYKVGVFASQGISTYLINYLLKNGKIQEDYNNIAIINNSPDALATRVSYIMNLTGISKTVQTFCSSSLVALEEAITNIKTGKCDIAIAGGVNIVVPQQSGYIYNEGSIYSPNGNVRPFDDSADGTVFSNGVGVVILARKKWAKDSGRHIYANILGAGINNDGSQKVSFLSPSIKGQTQCITEAYGKAGISPEKVAYVETHGTATKVGDVIEAHALIKAFENFTSNKRYCAIGSIKGNVGHLDRAAGITSFIKGCLIAKNRCIPPIVYHNKINHNIDFDDTPFYINDQPISYDKNEDMIIGVSALGVGGTNVHVVLSGIKDDTIIVNNRQSYIFNFSAKCKESLFAYFNEFKKYISNRDLELQKIETTLQLYRNKFPVRFSIVAGSKEELLHKLTEAESCFKGQCFMGKVNTIVFKIGSEADKLIKTVCSICKTEELMRSILSKEISSLVKKNYETITDLEKTLMDLGKEGIKLIKVAVKMYFSELLYEKVIILFDDGKQEIPRFIYDDRTIFVQSDVIFSTENDISGFYLVLSRLWNSGLDIDWNKYNMGFERKMIHLPGYAFKKTRCWIDDCKKKKSFFRSFESDFEEFCSESEEQFERIQKVINKGGLL